MQRTWTRITQSQSLGMPTNLQVILDMERATSSTSQAREGKATTGMIICVVEISRSFSRAPSFLKPLILTSRSGIRIRTLTLLRWAWLNQQPGQGPLVSSGMNQRLALRDSNKTLSKKTTVLTMLWHQDRKLLSARLWWLKITKQKVQCMWGKSSRRAVQAIRRFSLLILRISIHQVSLLQ